MKKLSLLLILSLCLSLSACGGSSDSSENSQMPDLSENSAIEETTNIEEDASQEEEKTAPIYFESDNIVNKFFADYNAIAEVTIPGEDIEKGNIRTKALVYIDDLSLEIINVSDYLSVSISVSVENEDSKLYPVFRDIIKSMQPDTTNEDIYASWESLHKSGYMVEDYGLNGIVLSYIPSKELSYGMSDLRVDMEIPLSS